MTKKDRDKTEMDPILVSLLALKTETSARGLFATQRVIDEAIKSVIVEAEELEKESQNHITS